MEKDDPKKSRGFGFVEFATLREASDAIDGLNEKQFGRRRLLVQIAEEKGSRKDAPRGATRGGRPSAGGQQRGGGYVPPPATSQEQYPPLDPYAGGGAGKRTGDHFPGAEVTAYAGYGESTKY